MTAEEIVQKNLNFYNKRDIPGFISLFSDDVKFFNFTDNSMTINGIADCKNFYQNLFDKSPKLYSTILKRITIDNKVIDHESIVGRNGSDDIFEIVLIYEVKDDKICKVTAIRK